MSGVFYKRYLAPVSVRVVLESDSKYAFFYQSFGGPLFVDVSFYTLPLFDPPVRQALYFFGRTCSSDYCRTLNLTSSFWLAALAQVAIILNVE